MELKGEEEPGRTLADFGQVPYTLDLIFYAVYMCIAFLGLLWQGKSKGLFFGNF